MTSRNERLTELVLVGLGGAVGATIRWALAEAWTVDTFPWPTLVVNVIGCALLASLTSDGVSMAMNRLLAVGFCGGLTTFSTLSVEVVRLLNDGQAGTAVVYLLASVVLGLAAFVVIRSMRAHNTEALVR